MDQDDVGPSGPQAHLGAQAAVRGAIVDDPEDATGGAIGLMLHDLLDKTLEGSDAGFL